MTGIKERTKPAAILATVALAAVLAALPPLSATAAPEVHRVGAVTRHASRFVGHYVRLTGYLLARRRGYVLFSDEPRGRISRYDLPVAGIGVATMQRQRRYLIEGEFLDHGLAASNGSRYHLELSAPPREFRR